MNWLYYFVALLVILVIMYKLLIPEYEIKFHHSRIDTGYSWEKPPYVDIWRFPKYYFSTCFKCIELHPGDAMFMPKDWFHWVFSKGEDNLALNFWWMENENKGKLPPIPILNEKIYKKNVPQKLKFNWDILQKWTLPYLENKLTTKTHCGKSNDTCFYPFQKPWVHNLDHKQVAWSIPFKEFRQKIKQDPTRSHAYLIDAKDNHELMKDLPFNYKDFKFFAINVWYFYNKASTGLHFDEYSNVLCQLKGVKRIYLFHPSQYKYLYCDQVMSRIARSDGDDDL